MSTDKIGDVHKPFDDDGLTYCGWDGHEGCGEAWPCSTVRARAAGGDSASEPPAGTINGRWLTLVPVEVFGLICDEHELPQPVGWGLCDAVQAWSDCNRADGHIYRVEDLDTAHRVPGETARIWVRDEELPFFETCWGERYPAPDEDVVGMVPPTAIHPAIAAAEARGRAVGRAEAIADLRSEVLRAMTPTVADQFEKAAVYLEAKGHQP
jgi:hypothetical protein